LIWSGGIGGIERCVETLVERDSRHAALLLDGAGPIGDALIANGRADRLGMRSGWDAARLAALVAALRRRAPRVVHPQTHALLPLLVTRLALPAAAWVYTEQSPRILASDLKFRLLYRFLTATRARMVAPAAAVAEAMRRLLPLDVPVTLIPNPCAVPIAVDAPRPLRDPPTIGVVARLEPQKRVDLLLEVVAALRRDHTDCRALIVGGGSCELALRRRSVELGVDGVVDFAGPVLETTSSLDRMDLFLATSASEPYGIAAVEAMARRVPVVAMPCPGGLAELVGEAGLLLDDRRIETAAAAVRGLLANDGARSELRARGARLAERSTPDAVLRQLQTIYQAPS
jgi:glycosyltransferase involved in cell wall biosynthesis